MYIICNGERKEVKQGSSLAAFLRELGIDPETVFAECNGTIVKKEEYPSFVLPEDARLELIRFVGGG